MTPDLVPATPDLPPQAASYPTPQAAAQQQGVSFSSPPSTAWHPTAGQPAYGQSTQPGHGHPPPAQPSFTPAAPLPYGYAAPLPYLQSPQPLVQTQRTDIASPWSRLLARIIDNVVFWGPFFLISVPIDGSSLASDALMFLPVFLGLAGLQAYLVATTGQSLGKKTLRIRIENHGGGNPGFDRAWLLRSFLFNLVEIPVSGLLLWIPSLVDSMMVFTRDGRTLHDRIAGTVVVNVNGRPPP
ncbi:MAG: RDD family protein [Nannocystaceae bacterium]|nr:RDD family protein [Nannocystaceae bacterium]